MRTSSRTDVALVNRRRGELPLMEIRQLRYAVTLADELHFGRAAEREHIVQSALSQQVRRLEREVGVKLFDRNTHQVSLTPAGAVFVAEARRILVHIDRAAEVARRATAEPKVLRIGFTEASYERIPAVVEAMLIDHPLLEVHQSAMSVPQQFELLSRGRLDVGVGSARFAPADIASEEFALDAVGVFVSSLHPWAGLNSITVNELHAATLLLGDADRAPEYNAFVVELCDRAGSHLGSARAVSTAFALPSTSWSIRPQCSAHHAPCGHAPPSCTGSSCVPSSLRRSGQPTTVASPSGTRNRCCGAPKTVRPSSAPSSAGVVSWPKSTTCARQKEPSPSAITRTDHPFADSLFPRRRHAALLTATVGTPAGGPQCR